MRNVARVWIVLLTLCGIAGLGACRQSAVEDLEDIPTLADIAAMSTALPLTQNAPPAPYNNPVTAFDRVDNRLNELAGWRYVVTFEFDGVFARTPREVDATARAEVWFNQLGSARRVVLATGGTLFGEDGGVQVEAVRLGRDAFLVQENGCTPNLNGTGGDAQAAADLGAGVLIGGVSRAVPAGRRATINGVEAYAFAFEPDALNLPSIQVGDGGTRTITGYDLWIAPAANAVIRFYVNLDVENATLLDSPLPVSGQAVVRYDLYDVGNAFNISVPFGC
ncbi:MAG: hypothetical protein SF162_12995 [bacterium]|nr:hypothetical protein [bacterium]